MGGGGAWYLCVAIPFQRHGQGKGHGSQSVCYDSMFLRHGEG